MKHRRPLIILCVIFVVIIVISALTLHVPKERVASWPLLVAPKNILSSINEPEDGASATTKECVPGLVSYSNARYGFTMCIPEDAEILTQFDAEDKSVLDLVFVQKSDIEKLQTSEMFATDPYFAVLYTGVSAFVLERSELLGEVDGERLRYILPKEIPCPHARFGCADGDTLAVELLSFEPVAGAPFPLFAYKDMVKAKKPWQNVGYIGHIDQASYQLESIVPESAVSPQALEIISTSIR
ncbi:MAG: hypothetical protein COV10_01720 [Candidatus Vogelbacteria bacterium CG10_big_fil_rev_8_21_14_0_10_51_16]|uniref:Uncharacterized protein n=1 Tax=Candidatus Vogelbacteria bacterium CG10_big_fil_rev_8_21_14_0_10_51_16 TaxID=1975045 RepID=A0A2H0REQ0_9BACT|nr:MAG: hypothetical protein COV10_01720 [Candidatus Vogelbacteria bacterium CG10_big_fil_rev_8_21_14_0_10_51_16]